MGVLAALLLLFAVLIVPIIVILAFVSPKTLNLKTDKRPEGKHNRQEFLTGLGLLWIVTLIAGSLMLPDEKKPTAKDTPAPVVSTPTSVNPVATPTPQAVASVPSAPKATIQEKTLGVTPEEFRDKYNAKLAELKIDITPPLPTGAIPLNNQNEKGSTFHLTANPSAEIVGTVAPNGKLKEVIVMFRGDDKQGLGLYTIASGAVFKSILGDKPNADVVLDLLSDAMKRPHKDNTPYEKTINNVRVYALAGAPLGIWLGFQAV